MNSRYRALLLGLAAGVGYTGVRVMLSSSRTVVVGGPDLERLIFDTLLHTLVLLAVVPGLTLYAARELDWPAEADRTALVALVGVGTLVAVAASWPVFTALEEGVALHRTLESRFVLAWAVNGVGPGVHAAVGALAGMLLSERNT